MTEGRNTTAWLIYQSCRGTEEKMKLRRSPENYGIDAGREGGLWTCRICASGAEIYRGNGPLRIEQEPISG